MRPLTSAVFDDVGAVLGDDRLDRFDCDLDHVVVGFLGGDALRPESGRGDDAGEGVVMLAAELDQLVADAAGQRESVIF